MGFETKPSFLSVITAEDLFFGCSNETYLSFGLQGFKRLPKRPKNLWTSLQYEKMRFAKILWKSMELVQMYSITIVRSVSPKIPPVTSIVIQKL